MDCRLPSWTGPPPPAPCAGTRGCGSSPSVAMTARAFDSDRAACREAGTDAFLPEPWPPEELEAVLSTRLVDVRPSSA